MFTDKYSFVAISINCADVAEIVYSKYNHPLACDELVCIVVYTYYIVGCLSLLMHD